MAKFIINIFFLSFIAFVSPSASEMRSQMTLKLLLSQRDFIPDSTLTPSQKMQQALKHSALRLHHLQQAMDAAAACVSNINITYLTSISTAPGAFITKASMGTPPFSFTAILDTGSDLVWLQCQPCISCLTSRPIFNPASSSTTYRNASCSDPLCNNNMLHAQCDNSACIYSYGYGDLSSTSGDLSYDTLTLSDVSGNPQKVSDFAFGCGHSNEGSDFAGADGIIGMGQGPLSLPSQLGCDQFSYCLQPTTDSASEMSPLFLGPGAINLSNNVQSTPIINNAMIPTLYYLRLQGISVGGELLQIPPYIFDLQVDGTGGTVIDSGTTITYLIEPAYSILLASFMSSISLAPADGSALGLDLCYAASNGTVPSLTLHFDGADLDLPTQNYFISIGGLFCLAIAGSPRISIVGNILQQNFHILYDRGAQRLSFAPAACDSL